MQMNEHQVLTKLVMVDPPPIPKFKVSETRCCVGVNKESLQQDGGVPKLMWMSLFFKWDTNQPASVLLGFPYRVVERFSTLFCPKPFDVC